MAFLDKAKEIAAQAKEKGEDAVATGKLMLKINEEKKNVKDAECEIGKIIVEQLDAGADFGERIGALYAKVKDAEKKIAEYEEEKAKVNE